MKTKILIIITAVFFAVMLVLTFSSRSIHEAGLPHVKAGRLSEAEVPIEFTDENGELMTGTRQAPAVTKEQLVGSKYIIGLCGLVLAELFAAAALGVASLHWTAVDHALVVSTLVQVGMTTLLNSAVLLPLNYRFGYEKAKYAFYLMVGLVAALMGFGVSANEDGLARNLLPQGVPPLALLGIVLIVLGLYSLSWRLSVAWYGKAEQ